MSETIEIKVPALGESVTEATVARWLKNEGDPVQIDETIIELETDKVTLEVSAPETGILQRIAFKKGSRVKMGATLGSIGVAETASHRPPLRTAPHNDSIVADNASHVAYAEHKSSVSTDAVKVAAHELPDSLSPAARRVLLEEQISPHKVHGTGKDGSILKSDVLNHINRSPAYDVPNTAPFSLKQESKNTQSPEQREHRVPMSRLRSRIAERLKEAQNTAAILTTFNEVDMSAVMELRTKFQDLFLKKHGVKLGFMSFFVKACVEALKRIPAVNAEIQGDDIVYKNFYDISVAVSAPQGLVVPVLRNVDQLSLADIEKGIALLGLKAKENKLSLSDLSGGTFTISNGGTFGSLLSTPIINPPQSGILGMHKIEDRPVAVKGRVEIRPSMYLALSYDHRIVDGREAVTFLVTIKECIENPGRFLLDL
ncbi:MAG: 2-oxoglutarate dehydrogenase complex dihydrolipoyllysine-residue succinyltransferase [Proteobacteria bacterium]|nr:2-oxoglutarate dehydrogenase complex dihydrolipoyllysine-residue succinyltransferase [Pseudomonadota bacterium]